jgi:hypothetical protein
MNSRSTKDVKAALDKMALYLEKYNVKVGVIHSDREGAFIELGSNSKYKFKYTAGPGTHEPMAERAIQTLKEIFRVKRSALPFKLPRSLYPKLLENVVMLTNYRLREGLTQTPDELLTGEKIRESDLVKGAFGRIALFKIPEEEVRIRKLDDLDDKAEYGVVVGMEHSNPKNLNVFLPMSTKAVVTRQGGKAAENIGQAHVGPFTQRQLQGVNQNGFTCPGFAGEHGESARHIQVQFAHDHKIAQNDVLQTHATPSFQCSF